MKKIINTALFLLFLAGAYVCCFDKAGKAQMVYNMAFMWGYIPLMCGVIMTNKTK